MKEALYYEKRGDGSVKCLLCPNYCVIGAGKFGACKVRANIEGTLYSTNWGIVAAAHLDPIEKKPLYHFYPSKYIFSIGNFGCNLRCSFCQNWEISQKGVPESAKKNIYTPADIVEKAKELLGEENIGIAYTYNEPTVWYEFMVETAKLAHESGLKNVMVTNGYINEEPLKELCKYIDAFNVDLKAFTDEFYRKETGARLEPVKRALEIVREAGKGLELTNLVIPTLNDDEGSFVEMVDWIESKLGNETVLHLSRYHPDYRLGIEATPADTLAALYGIAAKKLKYVYVGNIYAGEREDTKCASCGKKVIKRNGYIIDILGIDKTGKCVNCGNKVVIRGEE